MNISRCQSALAIYVFFFFTILLFSTKGVAMSMFSANEEEVVLFSPIEGKVTFEGKPAAGAKIIRSIKWKDQKEEEDSVVSNERGEFEFAIKTALRKSNSLSQFVVHQKIFVQFNGERYQVWGNGKLEKELFTEFGGKPKNLRCELTDEPDRVDTKNGWVMTSCQWDLEE
jgi:hypothetical protein